MTFAQQPIHECQSFASTLIICPQERSTAKTVLTVHFNTCENIFGVKTVKISSSKLFFEKVSSIMYKTLPIIKAFLVLAIENIEFKT